MSPGLALLTTVVATTSVLGLFLMLWGWFGSWKPRPPKPPKPTGGPRTSTAGDVVKRILLAVGLAAGLYLMTGWPVAGLFGLAAGFAWLSVRREAQRKAHQLAQMTALATWAEGLKDTMAASAGITEALNISARIAPPEIETEVNYLVTRMRTQSTTAALQQFAADVANPAADMIVAALTLALTKQAGSLQGVLGAIAQNARDLATLLQQIEAGRTEVRTQSKLAVGVIGSIMLGMILLRRDSLHPFDTLVGQLVLAIILGMFSLAGYMLYRLGKSEPPRRVFSRVVAPPVQLAQEPIR